MRKIITLIFIITLVSCEKNNQIIQDQDNLLIGSWTDVNYTEGKTSFSKSNSLPENNYGISFKIPSKIPFPTPLKILRRTAR